MMGTDLKRIREEQGITVQQLANDIGVSRSVIYYVEEREEMNLRVNIFVKWLTALGLDPSEAIKKI